MVMHTHRRDNRYKTYVKVRLDHDTDGTMHPLMFRPEGGEKIKIDKIVEVRIAASLRVGGQGVRYTCMVRRREIYLYLDGDYWFVENAQLGVIQSG